MEQKTNKVNIKINGTWKECITYKKIGNNWIELSPKELHDYVNDKKIIRK